MPTLQADAVVVHLFVAADGPQRASDRAYLIEVWRRCRDTLGMTGSLAELPTEPRLDAGTGLLAGLRHPAAVAPCVQEALLRRERDTFCLSVMREPASSTWNELHEAWSDAMKDLPASPGVLGSAQLFLARLTDAHRLMRLLRHRTPDPALLGRAVRARLPINQTGAPLWGPGVLVSPGFAVWEASPADDERSLRRIVVLAAADADVPLSGWTWVSGERRDLPVFGRYLLHAAKLRYQLRVWSAEHAGIRDLCGTADATVDRLLDLLTPQQAGQEPTTAQLLDAAKEIAALQAAGPGLVRTATRMTAMRRSVEIATANLTALSERDAGGLFADDRALGAWLGRQLDDDEVYVSATRERTGQVGALTDQLLQRMAHAEQEALRTRQERFNLGLTGAVGAILMVLAAIQALGYRPPVPERVQPAVVTLLGTVALLATLLVLRVAAPGRWWSRLLLWLGYALLGGAGIWLFVAIAGGR